MAAAADASASDHQQQHQQGGGGGTPQQQGGAGAAGVFAARYDPAAAASAPPERGVSSETLESYRERAQTDGASELGLTKEEFEARKIRATSPYKVKREGKPDLKVLSSARAGQIMTEGSVERTSNRKTAEVSKRDKDMRYFNYVMVVVGLVMAAFVAVAWLKPVIDLRNQRYARQKRRHEEFFLPALAKLEQEKAQELEMIKAAAAAGVVIPGSPPPSLLGISTPDASVAKQK